MTSNRPMLVGLDDRAYLQNSLLAEANFQTIKECFAQNPATDSPIDINNLFVTSNSSKEEIANALSLWGHLQGYTPENNHEVRKETIFPELGTHKLEKYNSNFYVTAKTGGVFTDKYYNKIYIINSDNPISNALVDRGYFGKAGIDYKVITAETNNSDFQNASHGAAWLSSLARRNSSISNYINGKLEEAGINKGKLNVPVMVKIKRNQDIININSIIEWAVYLEILLNVVDSVFPAVKSITEPIRNAIKKSNEVINTVIKDPQNFKFDFNGIKQIGKALLPTTAEGDKSIWNYLDKGTEIYSAYQNKDYLTLATQLGLGKQYANPNMIAVLQGDIDKNNIMKIRDAQTNKMSVSEINATIQNYRNTNQIGLWAEATAMNIDESKLLTSIQKNGGVANSPEFLNFMTAYAGGGYMSAIPTTGEKKGQDAIAKVMQIDSSWKDSAAIHKAYLNMAVGLPTGTAAFDELLLAGLENQIKTTGSKVITLPAQLPKEKAQCIAKELSANGYTIYTSEYQLTGKGGNFPLEDAKDAIENGKYYRRVYK